MSTWSFILIPDTQYLCTPSNGWASYLNGMRDWIIANHAAHNVQFIGGLGDIVDLGHDPASWDIAATGLMPLLNLGMPALLLTAGNHDADTFGDQPARDFDNFNARFGPSVYEDKDWFGGVYETGKAQNAWATFTAEGRDYLAFMVEFFPRAGVMDWVKAICAAHPDRLVIIVTHAFLHMDGYRSSYATLPHGPAGYWSDPANQDVHGGEEMWQGWLKDIPNLLGVFNGHFVSDNIAYRIDPADPGNNVLQGFYNWQYADSGGRGRIVLMTVDDVAWTIHQQVIRTDLDAFETGTQDGFNYDTTHTIGAPLPPLPPALMPGDYVVGGQAVDVGGVPHIIRV